MEINYINSTGKETNVVYLMTFYGKYGKKYHYIGQTSRTLKRRTWEHLHEKKDRVYKTIQEIKPKKLEVSIIEQCKYSITLETRETIAIGNYILKRGTRNNQRNRLINKLYKGWLNKTRVQIEEIMAEMQGA